MADIESSLFFITCVLYNTRISTKRASLGHGLSGIPTKLTLNEEILLVGIIKNLVIENEYRVLSFNICSDHIHCIIDCSYSDLPLIIQTIKAKSSYAFHKLLKEDLKMTRGFNPLIADIKQERKNFLIERPLWAQKFHRKEIVDLNKLHLATDYIETNRFKHDLVESEVLNNLIESFLIKV